MIYAMIMVQRVSESLTPRERRIWDMHCQGMPPSEIAHRFQTDVDMVKSVIVGEWASDQRRAKNRFL